MDGPLLVLAGAGSGKTRVITRKVAYLIQQGVAPWHVLAITFSNKAAGELRHRVEALGTPRGATVCTFHALCARLLREFADEAHLAANYSIYDREDQLRLTKEAMARAGLGSDSIAPPRIHASISKAKNDLKTPDACAEEAGSSPHMRTVAKVYREYEALLRANNALDFDDLLLRMVRLLGARSDIRELLGRRYRYVLVDEYQDVNRAQYILTHGIVLDHKNICATGDPDQSIYAWRGADIGNILEFEADYPDATVIRLEENYRSTRPILAAASRLIAHNRLRKEKDLWTRRTGGAEVRVVYCNDEHAEAGEVARRIAALGASGTRYGDVAVFYRVNSLSRVVEETLVHSGIAYRVARGVEFYNRKEVKDVLAYLSLLVNPRHDVACRRVINTPARGIGAATVGRLAALAQSRGLSLLEACRLGADAGLSPSAARKTQAFAQLIDSLSGDLRRSVRDIMEDVVRRSGLQDALSDRPQEEKDNRPLANVEELISTAAEFDAAGGGTLADYLHLVSLVSDVDHLEGTGGAVTLMTLHAAKGLEFPVVFIVGCESGLLPLDRPSESRKGEWEAKEGEELEEERRLAFVGMTRAKDELTLTCARRRMIRGRNRSQAASPFLFQIGTEHVTVEDMTTPQMEERPAGAARQGGFYADSQERAVIEAMAEKFPMPPEYRYLRPGCLVHHPTYGVGKVLRITDPWPNTKAEIVFEDCGAKKIVLRSARLELAQ